MQLAMMPQYEAQARPQVEAMGIEKMICYEEAFQMITYYLKCDKFKKIPKFLEMQAKVLPFVKARLESKTFEYFLSCGENLGVLVCMIGKTGDKTMIATLRKNEVDCFQNHYIWMNQKEFFPEQTIKIITAVREPIARDISAEYESASRIGMHTYNSKIYLEKSNDIQFFYDHFCDKEERKKKTEAVAQRFGLEKMPEDLNLFGIGGWFHRFKENVVDLLNHPFDQEKGYTIIKEGNYDIFVYQLEKLNDLVPELSDWVGVPFTELVNGNEASSKWIAKSYKQAQKELKFSQEYFDACYNDPYVKHCYSEADIEKFKDRWRGNIDPNK